MDIGKLNMANGRRGKRSTPRIRSCPTVADAGPTFHVGGEAPPLNMDNAVNAIGVHIGSTDECDAAALRTVAGCAGVAVEQVFNHAAGELLLAEIDLAEVFSLQQRGFFFALGAE